MFTVAKSSLAQRLFCMLMATVVVASSVALGALSSYYKTHNNYSVTITQLR